MRRRSGVVDQPPISTTSTFIDTTPAGWSRPLREPAMPRRPRVFVEGGIYHICCRTARRAPVLADECEAQRFLGVVREVTQRGRFAVLAWCLMPKHHHFVRRTAEVPLWRSMRRIAGALRPVPQAPPLHPRQPVAGALQGVDHRHPGIPRARPGLRSPQPGDRGAREAPRGVAMARASGARGRHPRAGRTSNGRRPWRESRSSGGVRRAGIERRCGRGRPQCSLVWRGTGCGVGSWRRRRVEAQTR